MAPPRCAIVVALMLGATAALADAPQRAPQGQGDEARARQEAAVKLHDEARGLYERGEYRLAITKLDAALALDPEGKELVYNLALIHEKLGDLDEAEAYYKRYYAMETDATIREHVQNILRRIEGAKKELTPPPPPPAPPPSAPPSPDTKQPKPKPRPAPARRAVGAWVYATGSIAAGAFLASGFFAITALAKNPGSTATTGPGRSVDDLEADARSAHRNAVLADITLVAGVLATGVALYLYFGAPVRDRSPVVAAAPFVFAPRAAARGLAFRSEL